MTLQEAKDDVAKNKNFIDWPDLCARDHYTNLEHATDKAAELYAQSQVNEAHNNAVEKCINAINKTATPNGIAMFLIEELKKLKR